MKNILKLILRIPDVKKIRVRRAFCTGNYRGPGPVVFFDFKELNQGLTNADFGTSKDCKLNNYVSIPIFQLVYTSTHAILIAYNKLYS